MRVWGQEHVRRAGSRGGEEDPGQFLPWGHTHKTQTYLGP